MRQLPRALIIAVAVAATAGVLLAVANRQFLVLWIFAGLAIFLAVTTQLTRPLAAAVRALNSAGLRIDVWGAPLGEAFRLDRVQAFGAGLLIWASAGERRVFIKIAQPRDVTQGNEAVTIGRAKYIQVNKRTAPVAAGAPAFVIRTA